MLVSGAVADNHFYPKLSAGLTADYKVTDSAGHILKSGPVALSSATASGALFTIKLPASAMTPGRVDVITITARDRDAAAGVSTAAAVVVPTNPVRGLSDAVFAANGTAGSLQSRVHGTVTFQKGAGGAVAMGGTGHFIIDADTDVGPVHTDGTGRFSVRSNSSGTVRGGVAASSVHLQLDGIAQGGFRTTLQGTVAIRRKADRTTTVGAAGRVIPTVGGVLDHTQGGGRGQLRVRTDGAGGFTLALGGNLRVKGSVHPFGPPRLF
jgi:hypothetical protein